MENKKTSIVVPSSPLGITTPEQLEQIAATAKKYNIETIMITGGQRLKFLDVDNDCATQVLDELGGSVPGGIKKGAHTVKACPGTMGCKYARENSLALAETLTRALSQMPVPGKVKVGISGCAFNCCQGYVRDIGIFAKKSGWVLIFGGNGGGKPRIGDIIKECLTSDEVIDLTRKTLEYYVAHARKHERTARFITRTGLEGLTRATLAG